jgi:hypothetical protein
MYKAITLDRALGASRQRLSGLFPLNPAALAVSLKIRAGFWRASPMAPSSTKRNAGRRCFRGCKAW